MHAITVAAAGPAPSPSLVTDGGLGPACTAVEGIYIVYQQHRYWRMKEYRFSHDPTNIPWSAVGSAGGKRAGAAMPADSGAGINRNVVEGHGTGLGDTRNACTPKRGSAVVMATVVPALVDATVTPGSTVGTSSQE